MSVISAGTTTTTAFKVTGDTTGTLQLQTGAVPTTAINISATQVVSIGNIAVTGGTVNNTIIGGTTAAAGSFTTLSAASTVTINGGTANQVQFLNSSKALTGSANLTFDGTTLTSGALALSTGVLTVPAGTVSAPAITTTGDTNTGIFFPAADTIAFAEGGVEALRIDSSANVGIGTSSPAQRLHVVGSARVTSKILADTATASAPSYTFEGWTDTGIWNPTGTSIGFSTAGAEKMRLDSSGNLGLGVTPAAGSVHLDVSNGASLYGLGAGTQIAANASFNGSSWLYRATNVASRMDIAPGGASGFAWFTAPSGTAGNPISFTQAMTLDASGRLGIGTTSPQTRLHVDQGADGNGITIAYAGRGASRCEWQVAGVNNEGCLFAHNNGTNKFTMLSMNRDALEFYTNNTERARFNSTGAFVFAGGTTNANGIGITFPATQVASSNANTLDDYEEGSFTFTLFAGSTSGASGTGFYTKIGRVVNVNLETPYATAWPSGGIYEVRGLPFSASGAPSFQGTMYSPGLSTTYRVVVPLIQTGFYPTAMRFVDNSLGNGGSWIGSEFGSSTFTPSTTFISITYTTAT